jgi:PAS domain S-box-containing protein
MRLTGFLESDLVGKDALDFIHPEDQAMAQQTYRKLFGPPFQPVLLEYRLRRKDGAYFWVEAIGAAVIKGSTNVTGIVTTTRNISKRKELEQDRLKKNEELTRINRELDQFAYIVSHDLKAPLRGISTLTGFIEEDLGQMDVPEEVKQHLVLMRGRTKRLEQLINDILAYSRAGKAKSEAEMIDTGSFFAEMVDMLSIPKAFEVHLGEGFPTMRGTKIYFEQVFSNLIYNAYLHHDKAVGNIWIDAKTVAGGWIFTVSDDGPGIPEADRERIFEVFAQLRQNDRNEGTGIGLAVVKKIIDTIHGTVTVSSRTPQGTAFSIFWPEMPSTEAILHI